MDRKRRAFLKTSLAGAVGATLLPACTGGTPTKQEPSAPPSPPPGAPAEPAAPAPAEPTPAEPAAAAGPIVRKLGKTGLEIPIVSIGAMTMTDPAILVAALDGGVRHIDTAHVYQGGRSEEMVAKAIAGRPRDSVILSTKVPPDEGGAKAFVEKFETSLGRLGVDYVDILYRHSAKGRKDVLDEPIMAAMTKLKQQGKVHHLGVSTHRNEPEVIRAAIESKVFEVVLAAYNFRQPHRDEMDKAIAEAAAAGIGIVAMKTQAGVYLDAARTKPINMTAALKWALKNPNVTTAIPGVTTFEQMELDLTVLPDTTLTPAEEKDLAEAQKTAGLFCSQCGDCAGQCDRGVDVPTLMRSYMYTYGYGNPARARDSLDRLGALACTDCDSCRVTSCTMGIDIARRVHDIRRLVSVPRQFIG